MVLDMATGPVRDLHHRNFKNMSLVYTSPLDMRSEVMVTYRYQYLFPTDHRVNMKLVIICKYDEGELA